MNAAFSCFYIIIGLFAGVLASKPIHQITLHEKKFICEHVEKAKCNQVWIKSGYDNG